jgi:basic membrane lipoprotein Med (substrate-binding protein (PBP1-ABC) superfamily)
MVGNVVNGAFRGGDNLFSLKDNATGYGPVGAMVPQSIIDQVNEQAHLIASGKLVPTTVIPAKL